MLDRKDIVNRIDFDQLNFDITDLLPIRFLRDVSGTYRSDAPIGTGTILELRVDVDGRRPMNRISGDLFRRFRLFGFYFTLYQSSFVVETVSTSHLTGEILLTGAVRYYNDPANNTDTIEVRIPRVNIFSPAPGATVRFYKSGALTSTYCAPKISDYFRTVRLEIDRFTGTAFPAAANTHAGVHPASLPNEDITTELVFQRSGIDLNVIQDDVLNDADSADAGNNWDELELHDLMETRFDSYANTLQWNLYGVVVPRFGDPNYSSGYYGVMFDWGGWQTGDRYLRQGAAIAYDAILGREAGTLYDTNAKKDRLMLQTFIHEIGHAFNLPHSWQRTNNDDSASESFMNYPWGYTGGAGTETAFWQNFRWEFDDVELIWMRHQDRNDVIFGGNDWIGNNLSIFTAPQMEQANAPLSLEVRTRSVYDLAEPVQVELKLTNVSGVPLQVDENLQPEDGTVEIYIQRPNGNLIRYIPPVQRCRVPEIVTLREGASLYESVLLSYSAKGAIFADPGEYQIRAYYIAQDMVAVSPAARLRVATPTSEEAEELAHLLFSPEAAKIMYLGGSTRYPETIARLVEATDVYAAAKPRVVGHIHRTLGEFFSRDHKVVTEKDGKRVVTVQAANRREAARHLEAALQMLPGTEVSALDNITHNRVATLLADLYIQQKNNAEATRVLRENKTYLQKRGVLKSVVDQSQKRIDRLKK